MSHPITSITIGTFAFLQPCLSRIPIINLFNAYDLQVNPLDEDKIRSQDVVNYCEARFRATLQEMMRRSEKDQIWIYKLLFQEMVFITAYFTAFPLTLRVIGIVFLLHRCGSSDRPTTEYSDHCQVTWPRHVPSRHDTQWYIPTRPRAHDIFGQQS